MRKEREERERKRTIPLLHGILCKLWRPSRRAALTFWQMRYERIEKERERTDFVWSSWLAIECGCWSMSYVRAANDGNLKRAVGN